MIRLTSCLAMLLAVVAVGSVQGSPIYLEVEGVPGEVQVAKYEGWIYVAAFGISVSQPAASPTGGGGSRDPEFSLFRVATTRVSKASPKLFEASLKGTRISSVKLALLRDVGAGVGNAEYVRWELRDVLVMSYETSAEVPELAVENVTFNFAEIRYIYTEYDELGKAQGNVVAEWSRGGELLSFSTEGDVSNFAFETGDPPAVPEPSTFALLSMGAVALLAYGRRRRRG